MSLCEKIQVNLAYRWFIGLSLEDEVTDHSSLTRILDRFGEKVFKEIFKHILRQFQKAGLVQVTYGLEAFVKLSALPQGDLFVLHSTAQTAFSKMLHTHGGLKNTVNPEA